MKKLYTAFGILLCSASLFTTASAQRQKQAHTLAPPSSSIQPEMPISLKTASSGLRSRATSSYYSNGAGVLVAGDSTVYRYTSKSASDYDTVVQYHFTSGVWIPTNKSFNIYGTGSLPTGSINQQWKVATGTWVNASKAINTYNGSGICIDYVNQSWVAASGTWVNSAHYIYTVNSAGVVTDETDQSWNTPTSAWVNKDRYLYTLNAQNWPLTQTVQTWSGGAFANVQLYTSVYDASGLNVVSSSGQNWDVPTASWKNSVKTAYTNNASGKPLVMASDWWNTTMTPVAWTPSAKSTFTYDVAGRELTNLFATYNTTTSAYTNDTRYTTAYTSGGDYDTYTGQQWISGAWGIGANSFKSYYYYEAYSPAGVNAASALDAQLSVSPVPANNELHVELMWKQSARAVTIVITDMQGRVGQQLAVPAAKSSSSVISVADVPAGNYLLSVKDDGGSIATKMIAVRH